MNDEQILPIEPNVKSAYLQVRLTDADREIITEAAKAEDMSVSAYVRRAALKLARAALVDALEATKTAVI
jgi:uncharacterized protein (DUF1778 family)